MTARKFESKRTRNSIVGLPIRKLRLVTLESLLSERPRVCEFRESELQRRCAVYKLTNVYKQIVVIAVNVLCCQGNWYSPGAQPGSAERPA